MNSKTGASWKKRDYGSYRFDRREQIILLVQGVGILLLLAYLFYDSIIAFVFLLPALYLYFQIRRRNRIRRQQEELRQQFRESLEALSVALQVGYSFENALSEAGKEVAVLCGKDAYMAVELQGMAAQLQMNGRIESLLLDFGIRSHVEEIQHFAEVFSIAKRSGGNLIGEMCESMRMIADRLELTKEIEVILAAKKLEHRVMSLIPFGMILYVRLTSPGFVDCLYQTPVGILVMTVCLLAYAGAFYLGERLIEIRV